MRLAPRLLCVALAAPGLLAQTFVVDQSNGPGTNFTTIGAAVAAVPSGSVLLVRAGGYGDSQPIILGKSLTILAQPGTVYVLPLGVPWQIMNLTAQQSVVISGVTVVGIVPGETATIRCQNNAGPVVLEGLGDWSNRRSVSIVGCSAVTVRNSTTYSSTPSDAAMSNVVFEQCGIYGALPGLTPPFPPAFVQQGGSVQMVGCYVSGSSLFNTVGGTAVLMHGGDLRLLDGTTVAGGAGSPTTAGLAIDGTGTVRLDPSVTITGIAPPLAPGITAVTQAMPRVTTSHAALNGTLVADLQGPGSSGFLAVSFRAQPLLVPGIADAIWLDPATSVLMGFGAPVSVSVPVPGFTALAGTQLVWQGFTFDAVLGLQASNASVSIVH